jgi:hypothetical protein
MRYDPPLPRVHGGPSGSCRPGAAHLWDGWAAVALALAGGMITTCCDHMADDDQFVFCDLNREFPLECQHLCAGFIADKDPTPGRERIWTLRVAGPAQAQAEVAIAEPGRGHAV